MREVYDEIINGRKIATVKVTDVFKYIVSIVVVVVVSYLFLFLLFLFTLHVFSEL